MAVIKNLTIDKYSTYERVFILLDKNKAPFNLTGFTANSQIRKSYKEDIETEFDCTILNPPTSGRVLLRLNYDKTANTVPGKYQYDILLSSITDPTEKIRAVEGTVDITSNITELD